MDTTLNILRTHYALIKDSGGWSFFLGVADYVKHVEETPELAKIISEEITARGELLNQKFKKIDDDLIREIDHSFSKILRIVKKGGLSKNSQLAAAIKTHKEKLEHVHKRSLLPRLSPFSDLLNESLLNVAETIDEIEKGALLHEFIDLKSSRNDLSSKYTFSPKLEAFGGSLSKEIQRETSTSLVTDWGKLMLLYNAVYKEQETTKELKENDEWTTLNALSFILREISDLKEHDRLPKTREADCLHLRKDVYLRHVSRINTLLEKKLHELNTEHSFVNKGKKRVTLLQFPRTMDWGKVSIHFISERDVLLSNGKDTKQSNYEGMGCKDGRNERPDSAWGFLRGLAQNNGAAGPIPKDERESVKKHKQKITDILRKIFQNDTDPFEKEKGGIYRAKFSIKPQEPESEQKKRGMFDDAEDAFSEMTSGQHI